MARPSRRQLGISWRWDNRLVCVQENGSHVFTAGPPPWWALPLEPAAKRTKDRAAAEPNKPFCGHVWTQASRVWAQGYISVVPCSNLSPGQF